MQLIATISLLFGATAMVNGYWIPDNGYRARCTCLSNGYLDQDLGKRACDSLGDIWPNLQYDWWTGTCIDVNLVGLEPNGFEAACQREPEERGPWSNTPFNPQAIRASCF